MQQLVILPFLMQCKVVYQHRIPQWSTVHAVQLPEQAAGMYHCRLAWGNEKLTTRILIQE